MCNFTGHVWRPAKQRENSSRAHAVHDRTLSHFGINDRTEGKNNVSFNNHRLITTYISEVMTSTNCIAFDILSALEAVFHPMNIRRTWLEYSSFFMRHERFMCVCVCAYTISEGLPGSDLMLTHIKRLSGASAQRLWPLIMTPNISAASSLSHPTSLRSQHVNFAWKYVFYWRYLLDQNYF